MQEEITIEKLYLEHKKDFEAFSSSITEKTRNILKSNGAELIFGINGGGEFYCDVLMFTVVDKNFGAYNDFVDFIYPDIRYNNVDKYVVTILPKNCPTNKAYEIIIKRIETLRERLERKTEAYRGLEKLLPYITSIEYKGDELKISITGFYDKLRDRIKSQAVEALIKLGKIKNNKYSGSKEDLVNFLVLFED